MQPQTRPRCLRDEPTDFKCYMHRRDEMCYFYAESLYWTLLLQSLPKAELSLRLAAKKEVDLHPKLTHYSYPVFIHHKNTFLTPQTPLLTIY
jgi:hypothetical protein